jgi:SHOCT-like protein
MNERRQILEMLAAGKINSDEADRLISALEKEAPGPASGGSEPRPKPKAKYLRVLVEPDANGVGKGPKVNIRVPMQLIRAGVKLTNLIPPYARMKVDDALREKGVAFDLSQLKPENLEELIDHLEDLTVDVDDDKDHIKVRVFCE